MSEERLQEIKDSVNFQREFLLAHNMGTLCVDEEQELIEEIERLNNIINELEKDLIEYFKKEYPDRKLEDYNLENCTYDYTLVILGRLQELKGSDK